MALDGKTNETLLWTRTYLGRDPVGPLAPLGGTESLLHSPPPKWERPRSHSRNLLCNLVRNLLPNLRVGTFNLQPPRSGVWTGNIVPQAQCDTQIFSWISAGSIRETGIFFIIFGFESEMPRGCRIIWKLCAGGRGSAGWWKFEFRLSLGGSGCRESECRCGRKLNKCRDGEFEWPCCGGCGCRYRDGYGPGDEHATALYAYFVDFDDLRYSRDLRQHYTTRTML